MEIFRLRLGRARVEPVFALRDVGYDSNLGTELNPVSDFTATVRGGVKTILPIGKKLFLKGDILPEYSWYADAAELRSFGGAYEGSLLALFNRASAGLFAQQRDRVGRLSSEYDRPVDQGLQRVAGEVEVDVLDRLSIFASGETQEWRLRTVALAEGLDDPRRLDRDESAARLGVRYRMRKYFDLSGRVEKTGTDFASSGQQGDNESTAILFGVFYNRPRLFINLSAGHRNGQARRGTAFPEYSTATGSYFVSYRATFPIEMAMFGRRGVGYALFAENPYYLETSNGVLVNLKLGRSISFNVRGELGSNAYPNPVLDATGNSRMRDDDVTEYGGGIGLRIYGNTWLNLLVTRTELDSNFDQLDRSTFRVASGISFQGRN